MDNSADFASFGAPSLQELKFVATSLAPDLNDGSLTETINVTRPEDVSDCYLMRNAHQEKTHFLRCY